MSVIASFDRPTTDDVVREAMFLASIGLRVMPLHWVDDDGECSCQSYFRVDKKHAQKSNGKHAIGKGWQDSATTDEETICEWWEKYPMAGLGVLMGPKPGSGIVDIEADTEAGVAKISELFGGVPRTPCFMSGKGPHYLFRYNDDLPAEGHRIGIDGCDIKIGGDGLGTLSVFPPTMHRTGSRYKWIQHPDDFPFMDIPDHVIAWIWNRGGSETEIKKGPKNSTADWKRLSKGVSEGSRNDAAAKYIGKMLGAVQDVFDQEMVDIIWEGCLNWNQGNQPPLEDTELRLVFESIWNREKAVRLNRNINEMYAKDYKARTDGDIPEGWKLIVQDTKPRLYRLFTPLWDGYVEVDTDAMLSPNGIRKQAMEQKMAYVPPWFDKLWRGDKKTQPLAKQLLELADFVEAPPEQHRDKVIATAILEVLYKVPEQAAAPKTNGKPTRMADGSIIFSFATMLEILAFSVDSITRNELSQVLSKAGAVWFDSDRKKLKRLSRNSVKVIEDIRDGKVLLSE